MTSTLAPVGDGHSATATCSTTAKDPATGQISVTGENGYYKGFSTLCTVVRQSDQAVVSSSASAPECASITDPSPTLGDNTLGTPASSCTWTFAITPGEAYRLVSRHFLWLNPASSSPYHCIDHNDAGYPTLSDPLAWFDNVNAYPPTGNTPVPVYPDTTTPGLSFTDTEEANISANGSGDEGCYGLETTVPVTGGFSGAWEIADTQAALATITLTNPDAPNITGAEFFQTQFATFESNLSDLQNIPDLTGTNLNWCLSPTPGLACFSSPASDAGGLGTPGGPNEALDTSSSSQVFYAAGNIPSGTVASPEIEYLCVQPTLQPSNYACTQLSLAELQLSACPGGVAGLCGSGTSSAPTLGPNQKQPFTATINDSAQLPPASNLASVLASNLTWGTWTLTGPASSCNPGPVVAFKGAPPATATNTYTYCSPVDYTGPASLAITASVVLPSSSAAAVPLADTADFKIQASVQSQTISFPPVLRQKAATSIPLTATASSALPLAFFSNTPAVCSVVGTTAHLLTAGTCSITAEQPGNATFRAASATLSFLVDFAGQVITVPTLSRQAVNSTLTLSATTTSNLPITYASRTPAVCSISGSTASLTALGTCTVHASQAGNATYLPAAANFSFLVARPAPKVVIVSSNPSIQAEASVIFTVSVFPTGPTPTGTVSFYSGATLLGQQTLAQGSASLSLNTLPGGRTTITAQYSGDASYAHATSAGIAQTVTKVTPTLQLSTNPDPVLARNAATLTVTAIDPSGRGNPSGIVDIYIDGIRLGRYTLTGGTVTSQSTTLSHGTHHVALQYHGDPFFTAVATTIPLAVNN